MSNPSLYTLNTVLNKKIATINEQFEISNKNGFYVTNDKPDLSIIRSKLHEVIYLCESMVSACDKVLDGE
jgi:hypothetical protein